MSGSKLSRWFVLWSAACAVVLFVSVVHAATVTVRGRIAFPDGEIPTFSDATLSGSGVHKVVAADEQGNYVLEDVPAGTYSLVIFAVGTRNGSGIFRRDKLLVSAQSEAPMVVDAVLSTDATKGGKKEAAAAAAPKQSKAAASKGSRSGSSKR